jgi:GAF domain-containing protein
VEYGNYHNAVRNRADRFSERLLDVVRQLSYVSSLAEVTEIVRQAVRQITGADGATFVLRQGDLVHYVDGDAIGPLWKGRHFDVHACISGWCILNRSAAAIEDIYSDPRIPVEAYRATFVKSLAMFPIRSEDPLGAIGDYWARRRRPSQWQVSALQALADAAALAFARFQGLEELDKSRISMVLPRPPQPIPPVPES